MFINPKATNLNQSQQANFISQYAKGSWVERNAAERVARVTSDPKELSTLFRKAMENYGKLLEEGSPGKGTRPWDIVDVTEGNDPNQAWIGLEWETGFCTRAEYKATVQYMWQTHHNWALDAEGIGPYYGEFTFPPINLSDWSAGKSMLDDMRSWMASKGISTPRTFGDIDFAGSGWDEDDYYSEGDATNGWGCHVNISVPGARTDSNHYSVVTEYMHRISGLIASMNRDQMEVLFNRNPYGLLYSRGSNDQRWHEWKLFRTPVSDEEVENIRSVSTRLAELTAHVAAHPTDFFELGKELGMDYIHLPSVQGLYDYLRGKVETLVLETRRLNSLSAAHRATILSL